MLSDWLRLMLEEIARKQTERESARAEQQQRDLEHAAAARGTDRADERQQARRP
jgi:hypothetical protein